MLLCIWNFVILFQLLFFKCHIVQQRLPDDIIFMYHKKDDVVRGDEWFCNAM